VYKASDGLYQLKLNLFNLNIDAGKGLITNLTLTAGTAVYRRLVRQHNAPNNVLSIHIDTLKYFLSKGHALSTYKIHPGNFHI